MEALEAFRLELTAAQERLADVATRKIPPNGDLALRAAFMQLPAELRRKLNAATRALHFGDDVCTQYNAIQADDDYATTLAPEDVDKVLATIEGAFPPERAPAEEHAPAEEPATEEPAEEHAPAEEPAEEPATEEPAEEPATEEPATEKPAEEPSTEEPSTEDEDPATGLD